MLAVDAASLSKLTLKVPVAKCGHTVRRSRDGTTFDGAGKYTSIASYDMSAFGGPAPVSCGEQVLTLQPPVHSAAVIEVGFLDATCNLHSIALSIEPGSEYTAVFPVVGGAELPLLDGADLPLTFSPVGTVALAAEAKVARLTLYSLGGGVVRACLQSFALIKTAASSSSVEAMTRSDSLSDALGEMLFADEKQADGIKRVPSKEQMGG